MERVLLSHPNIQEAVVCGISQTRAGSLEETQVDGEIFRNQDIRAYIVKDEASDLTAQELE